MTKDFERVYHSLDRVAYVKALPCVACGRSPSENAHQGTGGTGRKSDYTTIIPLCPRCHREQHQHGAKTFAAKYNLDYAALAEETQRSWLAHLNGGDV